MKYGSEDILMNQGWLWFDRHIW